MMWRMFYIHLYYFSKVHFTNEYGTVCIDYSWVKAGEGGRGGLEGLKPPSPRILEQIKNVKSAKISEFYYNFFSSPESTKKSFWLRP